MRPDATELGEARRRVEALVSGLPGAAPTRRPSTRHGRSERSRWPWRPTTTGSTSGRSSSCRWSSRSGSGSRAAGTPTPSPGPETRAGCVWQAEITRPASRFHRCTCRCQSRVGRVDQVAVGALPVPYL